MLKTGWLINLTSIPRGRKVQNVPQRKWFRYLSKRAQRVDSDSLAVASDDVMDVNMTKGENKNWWWSRDSHGNVDISTMGPLGQMGMTTAESSFSHGPSSE